MKSTLPKLAGLLGLMAALCVNSAMAQQVIHFGSNAGSDGAGMAMAGDNGSSPFAEESAQPASPGSYYGNGGCGDCGDGCGYGECCGSECGACRKCHCDCLGCDPGPCVGIEAFTGVECSRNITNSSFQIRPVWLRAAISACHCPGCASMASVHSWAPVIAPAILMAATLASSIPTVHSACSAATNASNRRSSQSAYFAGHSTAKRLRRISMWVSPTIGC